MGWMGGGVDTQNEGGGVFKMEVVLTPLRTMQLYHI